MSVTTADNPTTTQLHRALDDYTIHLTGSEPEPVNSRPEADVENPPNWPREYHNVPAYRPINRHLDFAERPNGSNPIERLFIYTMLSGVWLNAVSRKSRGFDASRADKNSRLLRRPGIRLVGGLMIQSSNTRSAESGEVEGV
jgi:hypothetical protein